MLRRYGADAEPARNMLVQYVEQKAADLFPDYPAEVRLSNPSTYELLQRLEDMLLTLKPANPRDQWWLAQAMTLAAKIGDTRWLIAQQIGQGTPKAFVALLVFWLALLFASFGLFCAAQLDVYGHLDLVRAGCDRRCGNVPRTGAGLWRPRPYLT